jgi:hypothetical protein
LCANLHNLLGELVDCRLSVSDTRLIEAEESVVSFSRNAPQLARERAPEIPFERSEFVRHAGDAEREWIDLPADSPDIIISI